MTADFEPIPVRPRRRADRGAILAVAIVAFVALALAKPWTAEADPNEAAGRRPDASHAAVERAPAVADGVTAASLHWRTLDDVVAARQRWGLRAVIAAESSSPGRQALREAWVATDPVAPGGLGSSARPGRIVSDAALLPDGGAVLAIGVTTPPDEPVLDLRAWRLGGGGLPRRLDARPVPGDGPVLDPLLLPPDADGRPAAAWPPGAYRLDLLLPDRVARYTVVVPGDSQPDEAEPAEPRPSLSTEAVEAVLRGRPTGSFALAEDGRYEAIGGRAGVALDEHAAWLDLGVRLSGGPGPSVDRVTTEAPVVLGVQLPAGATGADAELVMLAPQAGPASIVRWSGAASRVAPLESLGSDGLLGRPPGVDAPRVAAPWFAFRAPADGSWPGGVYRIDARWLDAAGAAHAAAWHLDVGGPPETREPALLAAMRAWTWVRGRWGIVAGTGNPLADDPRDTWIRHTVREPEPGGRDPAALGVACNGGAPIVAGVGVVGITHPPGAAPEALEVRRLFDGGRSLGVPVAVRRDALPGLSLVAPRFVARWAPGHYLVELGVGDPPSALPFCAGTLIGAGLEVPPSASGDAAFERELRGQLSGSRGGGLVVGRLPAVDGRAPSPERACGPDQRSWRRHDPARDVPTLWDDLAARGGAWGVAAAGTHVCRDEPHTWTTWLGLPDGGAPSDPPDCGAALLLPPRPSLLAVTAPAGADAAWTIVGWLTDADGRTVLAPPIERLRTDDRTVTAFAFADRSIWADGVYRLRIPGRGRGLEHVDICLGMR